MIKPTIISYYSPISKLYFVFTVIAVFLTRKTISINSALEFRRLLILFEANLMPS